MYNSEYMLSIKGDSSHYIIIQPIKRTESIVYRSD